MDKQTVTLILLQAWLDLLEIAIAADLVDDLVNCLIHMNDGDSAVTDRHKQKKW